MTDPLAGVVSHRRPLRAGPLDSEPPRAAGGLCHKVVALGLDQLVLYVSATAFEDGLFRRGMDEEEMLRYYAGVHAFYAALPADRYPVLASIAPDMTGHDDVERFNFGLDVLISGLEAVNARVRDSGQGMGQGEP